MADLDRDHDIDVASVALLVVRGIAHERLCGKVRPRGQAVGSCAALDARGRLGGTPAVGRRGARHHAEPGRHARAVTKREVARGLDGVADGVAKVEGLAQAALALVCAHHVALDGNVAGDDLAESLVAVSRGERLRLKLLKQGGVGEDRVLDDLSAGVAEEVG